MCYGVKIWCYFQWLVSQNEFSCKLIDLLFENCLEFLKNGLFHIFLLALVSFSSYFHFLYPRSERIKNDSKEDTKIDLLLKLSNTRKFKSFVKLIWTSFGCIMNLNGRYIVHHCNPILKKPLNILWRNESLSTWVKKENIQRFLICKVQRSAEKIIGTPSSMTSERIDANELAPCKRTPQQSHTKSLNSMESL